jgi:ribonuclease P protein component
VSRDRRLRTSEEFRLVYAKGRRYDTRWFTVFIYPRGFANHRLGVTASSKAVGSAVERNRAKRILREIFRLSAADLDLITSKYDWVLNAKRSLLVSKAEDRAAEFKKVIQQVAKADLSAN